MSNTHTAIISFVLAVAFSLAQAADAEEQRPTPSPGPVVSITVERRTVAVDEVFWIDVSVRWPEQPQRSGMMTVASGSRDAVTLAPGSPFEVVAQMQSGLSMQMSTDSSGAMAVNREQRIRWQVRVTQPGQHPVVVQVGGKVFRDSNAVVTVTPASGSGGTF